MQINTMAIITLQLLLEIIDTPERGEIIEDNSITLQREEKKVTGLVYEIRKSNGFYLVPKNNK